MSPWYLKIYGNLFCLRAELLTQQGIIFKCKSRCKAFDEVSKKQLLNLSMSHYILDSWCLPVIGSNCEDMNFHTNLLLMYPMCLLWVMFSTLTGIVQCLLSAHCLDNSIPTEPKSNNCETKLLILFLLCSSMHSNTFQSNIMQSVSILMSTLCNIHIWFSIFLPDSPVKLLIRNWRLTLSCEVFKGLHSYCSSDQHSDTFGCHANEICAFVFTVFIINSDEFDVMLCV